jgi:hypothetical protein
MNTDKHLNKFKAQIKVIPLFQRHIMTTKEAKQ